MTKAILKSSFIFAAIILLSACSTIFSGGGPESVAMSSEPKGATFTITDENGELVTSGVTPATIHLDPADGFFDGDKYTVVFEMEGYDPVTAELDSTINGWVFGNIIGGVVGIVVDGATGAIFDLDDTLHADLVITSTDGPTAAADTNSQDPVEQTKVN